MCQFLSIYYLLSFIHSVFNFLHNRCHSLYPLLVNTLLLKKMFANLCNAFSIYFKSRKNQNIKVPLWPFSGREGEGTMNR